MKLKKMMNSEAKKLLEEKKTAVYPDLPARGASRRRVPAAVLAVALIAALIVPLTVAALHRSAPAPAEDAPGESSAVAGKHTAASVPTVPDESTEHTVPTLTTAPDEPAGSGALTLPRVPENAGLYFAVPSEYLRSNDVRAAYTPDAEGQAAIARLLSDPDAGYKELDRLVSRFAWRQDENGERVESTVPFVFWGADKEGRYKPCDLYYFFEIDASEFGLTAEDFSGACFLDDEPYRFTFEIWYREAGCEDFRGISTTVSSGVLPYIYTVEPDDEWQPVVIRVPTYNAGIRDLHTEDGQPSDYEFVVVIRDRENDGAVLGWKALTVTITGEYEELLAYGFENGLLELPQQ